MRHRVHKKTFNRDTKARRALLLGVTSAVLWHGEVITTRAKAKAAIPLIEKSISRAKVGDLNARRQLHRLFGRRDVVNNLCDRVAPVFKDRQSGFTRLTLVGNRRGDNTALYRLSLVEALPVVEKRPQEKVAPAAKAAKTDKSGK
ncbi:50S ribosomal protein L17 [bacterium]|nr:50S ribosomal protein L17 [bacterium]